MKHATAPAHTAPGPFRRIGIEESAAQAWKYHTLAAAQGHAEARQKVEAGG